jgi:DNA-binding NarL/FixJ family response regulator
MENIPIPRDNPLTSITLRFKDGAVLRQVLKRAVPQVEVMAALGRMIAELGDELNLQGEVIELTPREMEVLRLIARGEPNKIIASELGIAEPTVKNYTSNIMEKLEANNRTHAVIIARERGIL